MKHLFEADNSSKVVIDSLIEKIKKKIESKSVWSLCGLLFVEKI